MQMLQNTHSPRLPKPPLLSSARLNTPKHPSQQQILQNLAPRSLGDHHRSPFGSSSCRSVSGRGRILIRIGPRGNFRFRPQERLFPCSSISRQESSQRHGGSKEKGQMLYTSEIDPEKRCDLPPINHTHPPGHLPLPLHPKHPLDALPPFWPIPCSSTGCGEDVPDGHGIVHFHGIG